MKSMGRKPRWLRVLLLGPALLCLTGLASAQGFQFAPQRIPQGAPFNNSFTENVDFADVSGTANTFAPRIPRLEQLADCAAGALQSVVRAHVFDNAEDYLTGHNLTTLENSVNGGSFQSVAMRWSDAQVFHGEVPGQLVGAIVYRGVSWDGYGNVGVSSTRSFNRAACVGAPFVYCAAKLNSCGNLPSISFTGAPSAS